MPVDTMSHDEYLDQSSVTRRVYQYLADAHPTIPADDVQVDEVVRIGMAGSDTIHDSKLDDAYALIDNYLSITTAELYTLFQKEFAERKGKRRRR